MAKQKRKKVFVLTPEEVNRLTKYDIRPRDVAKMVQLSTGCYQNSSAKSKYARLVAEGLRIAEARAVRIANDLIKSL